MIQEIKMPSAGQTTDEATIVALNVKVGDTVKRGDVIVEAETDKAVLPVECFTNGTVLDVLVAVGDKVDAGTVLVAVGKAGERYSRPCAKAAPAVAPAPAPAPAAPTAPAKPAAGTEIKMPSAGQTTDEAKIVSVNVKVGDKIKRGDVIVEAETDKAVLPVESFAAGEVLEILVAVGDTVTAGTVLAVVGKPGQAVVRPAAALAPKAAPVPASVKEKDEYQPIVKGQAPPKKPATEEKPHSAWPAMPNAKKLAKEMNIPLAELSPSNGKFLKRVDVLAYQAPETKTCQTSPAAEETPYKVLPMTNVRKVISRRMLESAQTIPAWQCTISVDMTACMNLRKQYQDKLGVKLSYNDILAKAIAVASKKFELINARYEQDEVRIYRHTNVGLAVSLDGALVVPVVKEIDTKGLIKISSDYKAMVKKARENRLTVDDMGCGSITISNLGMYDVDQFVAIVNPPESCILAVGKIEMKPVWDGTAFQPMPMMNITGSFDHRIIDGAYGAQFLKEVKGLLETPALMLA